MNASLSPYLRSLWNVAPPLFDIAEAGATRPFLSPRGLHLPQRAPTGECPDDWFHAAAAHAAAHLVFSQHRFDPAGLGPIVQALVGLLEDARVEWLASRELPGLRRLWRPFHAVAIDDTPGFEDLMRRLACSLLDPQHHDPHPWVIKGRQLFFVDEAGEMLALRQPEALRQAAMRLGHDIGQMRLRFNARLYQVAPSYRDDNTCLWRHDERRAEAEHELPTDPGDGPAGPREEARIEPRTQRHLYPEWDRQVPMVRRDWCAVHDVPAPAGEPVAFDTAALRGLAPQACVRLTRQADGDEFDLDALVQARVSQRCGAVPELRVYQRRQCRPRSGATLLLVDTSASTAKTPAGATASLLAAMKAAAWRSALVLPRVAIHAFCSDGRHAVHVERVKGFDQPLDAACAARLAGLRSRLSTRLGAALRHATRLVAAQPGAWKRVLLFTDGKPHDIDVHDPKYLVEDARQAVREAARGGVLVQCFSFDRAAVRSLQKVFGVRQVAAVPRAADLPGAMLRLAASAS